MMIDELTEKEDDIKNEVVAAYGEVLRKLKINKLLDNPINLHPEEVLKERLSVLNSEEEITHLPSPEKIETPISSLKNYFLNTLDNLETALLSEQKKLTSLENEIIEKMQAWQQEEKEYVAKRDLQREKEQLRYENAKKAEEKDYLYQRDLEREKDRIQYEMSKRELENALREQEKRMQAREEEFRRIKEKETWILSTEQEYHSLKQRAEHFPDEIRQAVQKAELTTAENLTLKYEYEMKLFNMEIESERKLHQQSIENIEAKYQQMIAKLEAQIAHLESLKYSFNKLAYNSMDTNSF